MTLPALQHATFLQRRATGNALCESGATPPAPRSSSQLWCIKLCKKFKAPFHLLSLWNSSSLDYKWQPHLHVKAEATREITCPFWAMPEEGKMPSLTTTVQTWGIDQRLCLEIKTSCGWETMHGIQGTGPQQLTQGALLLPAASPSLWKDFLSGEAGPRFDANLLVLNMHRPRFCFQTIHICIVPVIKVINDPN